MSDKTRKRTPTLKQIKTLQLINQGYSTHRAMKEAGYAQSTLNQSYKFKQSPVVKSMLMDLNKRLYEKGFTSEFIAGKFMEWMGAEKPFASHTEPDRMVPDYDIQIKAFKEAKEILKPAEHEKGIKRKITLEEFINEGDNV